MKQFSVRDEYKYFMRCLPVRIENRGEKKKKISRQAIRTKTHTMVKNLIRRPYDRTAARQTRKKNRELKQRNYERSLKGLPPLEKKKKPRPYKLTGKYVGRFSGNRKNYNRSDLQHLNKTTGNVAAATRSSKKYTGKYPNWYKMNEEKKNKSKDKIK